MGAYRAGADPQLDRAIARHPQLVGFLNQSVSERVSFEESVAALESVLFDGA